MLVRSWTRILCLRNWAFTCGLTPTYRPTGTVGREERVYYAKFTRPSLEGLGLSFRDLSHSHQQVDATPIIN